MRHARAIASALPFLLAAPLAAQSLPLAAIDSIVAAELRQQRIPGVAVAVIRRDTVLLARGWGQANVEHAVPVTERTIFQSGSIGKMFTATAVMLLVEDGTLALDAPIARYLPEAPAAWQRITVRHLLTHTSGIPDYGPEQVDLRRDYTDDEFVKIAGGLTLEFAPGTRWNYSNTGYVLLGVIVQRTSGRSYGDILAERVFRPLGMTTARVISERAIVPHRAAGYELEGDSLRNQEWVAPAFNRTADGALYLSLQDYIAWDRGVRRRAILKPSSWQAILTPVRLASGRPYPYGFGWSIDTVGTQVVHRHGGSWQGFQTYLARYQGDDLTIVALANLAQGNPQRIVQRVAQAVNPALDETPRSAAARPDAEGERRLRELLERTRAGTLDSQLFAYVRNGFFPDMPRRYHASLRDLGAPSATRLLRSGTIGDDRIWQYEVTWPTATFVVSFAVEPEGRYTQFRLRRK